MATVDTLIEQIREKTEAVVSTGKNHLLKDTLRERAKHRVGTQHEDASDINPCLIPVVILGSKFDIFQTFEADKRKAMNRYLRLTAHTTGGSLFYFSIKSEVTVNRMKGILNSLSFSRTDKSEGQSTSLDVNRPLVIPFGSDSFQLIGSISLEGVRKELTELYPDQVVSKFVIPDNPAKDVKFKERDIDLVRDVRDQELEDYRRQLQLRIPDDASGILP